MLARSVYLALATATATATATAEAGDGAIHRDRLIFCPLATLELIETLQSADDLCGSPGSEGFLAAWANHEKQRAVIAKAKAGRQSGCRVSAFLATENRRLNLFIGRSSTSDNTP